MAEQDTCMFALLGVWEVFVAVFQAAGSPQIYHARLC
jgi:hypothetical protein